jgi:hypothetical protein
LTPTEPPAPPKLTDREHYLLRDLLGQAYRLMHSATDDLDTMRAISAWHSDGCVLARKVAT